MNTSNEISIRGDLSKIFDLAARVEDWGDILPHYRYVKLLRSYGPDRNLVEMSAWRDFVPVTWTALQVVERGTPEAPGRIIFKHVRGLVRGMEVEWWFQERPDQGDVLVGIRHDLAKPPFPTLMLGPFVEPVVGRGFIGYIAGKTLKRIKELAESSAER